MPRDHGFLTGFPPGIAWRERSRRIRIALNVEDTLIETANAGSPMTMPRRDASGGAGHAVEVERQFVPGSASSVVITCVSFGRLSVSVPESNCGVSLGADNPQRQF